MDTPAARVIAKFGEGTKGHYRVAELLGRHVSRVFRWTYPKERGGTGGLIPPREQDRLLEIARREGVALARSDFFDDAGVGPADPTDSQAAA